MILLIVIPMIHRANQSNGITALLELALQARSQDHDVYVYPTFEDPFVSNLNIPKCYRDLRISTRIPDGCTAIIPDTANPKDVGLIRNSAARVVWYSLAVPGMFTACSIPFIKRHPGETEFVYSSQVSSIFPQVYIQTRFPQLEHLLECHDFSKKRRTLRKPGSPDKQSQQRQLLPAILSGIP